MSAGDESVGPGRLRVHRFMPRTRSEGPGWRAALWVQGCPIRCPGCFNPQTWDFLGGRDMSVREVLERIFVAGDIEGISLLGGEPFAQAAALADVAVGCRARGLSVVTFTGYTHRHIVSADRPDWNRLLGATDLLLAGPYLRDHADLSRPWVGSRNQEFCFLTPRYRALANRFGGLANAIEVHVADDGAIGLNGMLGDRELEALEAELRSLGLAISGDALETP